MTTTSESLAQVFCKELNAHLGHRLSGTFVMHPDDYCLLVQEGGVVFHAEGPPTFMGIDIRISRDRMAGDPGMEVPNG